VTGSRIYHIGIVVPQLEPAMEELSAAAGITWARPQRDVRVTYGTPDGPRTWDVTFVYSDQPPYIELLLRSDGTLWTEVGLHHLGIWSDDVDADSAALERRGCVWQAALTDGTGARLGGCYHLMPASGSRIEFASTERSRPRLDRYLAGGDYM
jgi:hypothetical protein